MSKFVTVEMVDTDGSFAPITIRKDKVVMVQRRGRTVIICVDGWSNPFTFTLDNEAYAKDLYRKIGIELEKTE